MRRSAAFRPQKQEHAQKWFKHTVSAAAFGGVNAALRGEVLPPGFPICAFCASWWQCLLAQSSGRSPCGAIFTSLGSNWPRTSTRSLWAAMTWWMSL